MSSQYKGMRWLKCDLQMQTPADALHWLGDKMLSGEEDTVAKAFAQACYDTKLNVVGITDHNFLSKDFIPYLLSAFKGIEEKYNHKITLFPGFEFEAAGVGRGVHVLCLFEPDTDLAKVDSVLTECGIQYPRQNTQGELVKSDKNLKDILLLVQNKHGGIVILPHAMSNDGIFDNDSVSPWLQQDQFVNPDLLAVEVPKPVNKMSKNFQKLFHSGDDCIAGWKRVRPIATLMSSDNKKLIDIGEDQKPTPNSIGYRYSWIKMSEPSIESLRQAFLDHESRIILPDDVSTDTNPAQRAQHARIQSISINNVAFLADQEIHLSPNLNCVIGGRGSGKSMLLEYLRIMLGKDKDKNLDSRTKEKIERVRGTLNDSNTKIKVCWISASGVTDSFIWQNNALTVDHELPDSETFFDNLPIRFYSQQQLNSLTESKKGSDGIRQAQRLLELIDGFTQNEINELASQENAIKLQINESFENLRRANTLDKECNRLKQEEQELERQWKARQEIQADADRHQQLKLESNYLDSILGSSDKQFSDVSALAISVADTHIPFQLEDSPHATWFQELDKQVKTAKLILAKNICDAIDKFHHEIETLKINDSKWESIRISLDQADTEFNKACTVKGLTPDDVGHLQEINQARAQKQLEIENITTKIKTLRDVAGDPEVLVQQLHKVWRKQFQTRTDATERANNLAVLDGGRQRFIDVSTKYQQDNQSFQQAWKKFAPKDGRNRLAKIWDEIGQKIYENFIKQPDEDSPWQMLYEKLSLEKEAIGKELGTTGNDLYTHIQENLEQWEKLRCSRVQDVVDMKLFRSDGTQAGNIAEGSLSDGQRNTAALALLLAQEGGPLVIDQPEDELDSNFVFKELIPMLRKVKAKRQLIMATHNANLPVNGDAELVYAFEARDGHGKVLAQGGLDQKEVTTAVLDILEGTEEAFRRRREKYNF